MPVHCPTCEAAVEATAKFCLQCGHDLLVIGPITSTGHDVRQLKELIRSRNDLAMSEKFDLISKIEEGANPIELGLAAASEEDAAIALAAESAQAPRETSPNDAVSSAVTSALSGGITRNPAAAAAVAAISHETSAWSLVSGGKVDLNSAAFLQAMELGMEASHHIHDIAAGGIEALSSEDLKAIPVLKPPKKSFCPKCGSDIHSHTMLQWRKWRDHSGEVVQLQTQAGMETAIIQTAGHYLASIDALESQVQELQAALDAADPESVKEAMAAEFDDEIRAKISAELEAALRDQIEEEIRAELVASRTISSRAGTVGRPMGTTFRPKSTPSPKPAVKKTEQKPEPKVEDEVEEPEPKVEDEEKKSEPEQEKKSAAQMMFGGGRKKISFEGEEADKPQWFLDNALHTIYDPHGTGKELKPRTILARSSDGNVRVQDVVRIYGDQGVEGLSELAWTSPLTQYIIEAYDGC
ncbi:MAG: zinc ribbon domain-containing protein [Candidatus Thermoplasmatota archaeon]|nr:zinc ribbon domain-containing protein [Candidatus Thermoplasmatota archaeon]